MENQNNNELLTQRDYTVIIDRSGSMGTKDSGSNLTRWEMAREATEAVARKVNEFDDDGLTVYEFNSNYRRYDNVTPQKVSDVFTHEPSGSTNLGAVLNDALGSYFRRKQAGKAKKGESFLIVTDGQPDNEAEVIEAISNATRKMTDPKELALTFIQIGHDQAATRFLKKLDDELEGKGAKYDIVDTLTVEDLGGKSLSDVLTASITEHKQST